MKNQEVIKYYDGVSANQIQDFIKPNIRIQNAIRECLLNIPKGIKSILDLGCGIGWSTFEFANHFNDSKVLGVDISPALIETASDVFKKSNLEYRSMDLTEGFPEGDFNAITLIDVFEHIPAQSRSSFYANMKVNLAEDGCVLFTCPTVKHQEFLRKNHPDRLQPVDEDVDLEVVSEFAEAINAQISFYRVFSIWDKDDYFIAKIERSETGQQQYLQKVDLLGFYEKYDMLNHSNVNRNLLPKLSQKQKIKALAKKILE